MEIYDSIEPMRQLMMQYRRAGKTIGLVPTMGYLHEGHLSLMRIAKEKTNVLVVSIYVNPSQFAPHEDFTAYPRSIERDLKMLEGIGCEVVFMPDNTTMYPSGYKTWLHIDDMMTPLCGVSRPIFFRGVATVVCKLFNIVRPHISVFGQKDAQQALIIKRMMADFNMDVEIIIGPTIREKDGLAVSSRNVYLSAEERKHAPVLYESLLLGKKLLLEKSHSRREILSRMTRLIESRPGAEIDYVEMVNTETLENIEEIMGMVLLALAVKFGNTRLIDNEMIEV